MFSDDEQSPFHPGGAGVIALVALLGGWLWVQDLPKSFREAEPPLHPAVRVLPDGVVDARLWQDPFSAVSEHLAGEEISYAYVIGDGAIPSQPATAETSADEAPSVEPRLPESYRALRESWSELPGRRVVVVGLLRGSSGAEEAERRRRQRHSMVSALAVQGLEPAHGTSLGWVWYRDQQRDLRMPIFFELFQRQSSGDLPQPDTALILWMNEDQIGSYTFGRDPLAVISEMVATFLDPILPGHSDPRERLAKTDVRIIGPGSSDALRTYFDRESTTTVLHYVGKLPRAAENVLGWTPWEGSMLGTFCAAPRVPDCDARLIQEIQDLIRAMAERRDAVRRAALRGGRNVPASHWRRWEPHILTSIDRHLVGWVIQSTESVGIQQDLCGDLARQFQVADGAAAGSCPQGVSDAKLGPRLSGVLDELEAPRVRATLDHWTQWIRRRLPVDETLRGLTLEQSSRAILHQWLLEWSSPKNSLKSVIRSELTIHSSRATAPIEELTDRPARERRFLRSSVADDQQVLALVVDELDHRRLDLTPESNDHVVLISEWDTAYGRIMPELFHDLSCDEQCTEEHPNVHRFSYLRGLDGIVPRSPLSDDRTQPGGADDSGIESEARPGAPFEPLGMPNAFLPRQRRQTTAFGRTQVDHVERIRSLIVREDLRLRRTGEGRVRAIGVLGSDFHDKQLILQVLRRHFRHAVFFTTDLDARYFDTDKQSWNRNLLVGSSYGLNLAPRLQQDIPPFRDSYSTAAFVATLDALDEIPGLAEGRTPRLFEISRSGAIDLTRDPDEPDLSLHPPRQKAHWNLSNWLFLVAFVPVAFLVVTAITPRAADDVPPWRSSLVLVTALLGVILTLMAIGHSHERVGSGEFVRWLDGVSIWPTEILRVLVIGLAVWVLWSTRLRLRRVEGEIGRRFFAEVQEPDEPAGRWWSRLSRGLLFSTHLRHAMSPDRTSTPETAWQTYRRLARGPARWTRTLLYFVLATAGFCVALNWLGLPDAPLRGIQAQRIDFFLQVVVLPVVFGTTLWLFDATFLAWLFVRRIAATRGEWSEAHLRDLGDTWGVDDTGDVTEIAEIEVIALLTRALWASLGAPFLLAGLLIVSRSRFFDGWTWPPSLVLFFVTLLVIALISAMLLRLRSQRARREALRSLTERSSQRDGDDPATPRGRASVRQIELMAEAIRNERRGALGGWWASPLARTGVLVAVVVILMLLDLTYA